MIQAPALRANASFLPMGDGTYPPESQTTVLPAAEEKDGMAEEGSEHRALSSMTRMTHVASFGARRLRGLS
jgi:hypothetical protein